MDRCPMSLGEFITHALIHPQYGYYMNRDPLGAKGDFITAPEVSQIFGEIIGAWIADIWIQMGSPKSFNLIEVGAGRGTMMADMLRVCRAVDGFLDAAQIRIIETSDVLQEKQRDALRGHAVTWHDNIEDMSVDKPCIILGNEFLDALPIEQLRRGSNGWEKRVVSVNDNGTLAFSWGSPENGLLDYLPPKTVSNEIYEVAPVRNDFIKACDYMVKANGGAALFIDYGYTKSHYGDTLQAVKNHSFVNVLGDVGNCDITSHIDFEALSSCCSSKTKTTTQRNFLMSLGIEYRANAVNAKSEDLERLIGKDQMGDLFKVMCLYDHKHINPAGF